MIIPILLMIIVTLIIYSPKNNKTIIIKDTQKDKSLAEKRLEDPLLPPERTHTTRLPINIRTQGPLPDYQQLGFIFQESTSTRLPLFGRPEYYGGQKYEYYVKDDSRNMIKIPLNETNELTTGEPVNVSGFQGDFVTEIYDLDSPKYIPYL